jgi:hypothetical protein
MNASNQSCQVEVDLKAAEEALLLKHRFQVSIDDLHFIRSTSLDERGVDEIDRMLDDMTVIDPYEVHAPSRRSDKDLCEFLKLLDSLEPGNGGKETTR